MAATALNSGVMAFFIAAVTASRSGGQSMTLSARIRPFWRSPMLTVGMCMAGASTMPLEELPSAISAPLRAER